MAFRHAATKTWRHSFAPSRKLRACCPTQFILARFQSSHGVPPSSTVYLHVGPSGDCWTGSSLFAAKHLPPDYVKSVPLVTGNTTSVPVDQQERIVELLEERADLAQQVYDTGSIPPEVWAMIEEEESG